MPQPSTAGLSKLLRIDAHQHFWQLATRVGEWPGPELGPIYRDFAPADLLPLLAASGVQGTVLVQTQPTLADTDFMLALADRHPFILGVVGWVDLKALDAPAHIARLARHPRFKGLRPMLQGLADDRWIDDVTLTPAIETLLAHQLSFDALVLPRQLPGLLAFALRYPALPIVIDHAAKPLVADKLMQPWLADMQALAALPNVHCKLSGLLTEAGDHPDAQSVAPYAMAVLDLFGPQRVIWGSDWPVVQLKGNYAAWLAICQACCEHLSTDDKEAVFGGNARRFYRLN